MRRLLPLVVTLLALAASGPKDLLALDVLLDGDRITLRADNDPLSAILARFVHAGVKVNMDPSIEANVSGSLDQEEMQDALDALLEQFSYVLVWDVIRGPVGELPKLAEIRIFKPENGTRNLQPFMPTSGNLEVAQGPLSTGPLFVKDEILIAVRRGINLDDFRNLLREIGGTIVSSIPHLGIYRVRVPAGTNILALVAQLEQRKMVANVEPNYVFKAPAPIIEAADPGGAEEPQVRPVRVAKGITPVAVLDSGMMPVEGLDAFVLGQLDALNPDQAVMDSSGHGTQMALIASGLIKPTGMPSGSPEDGVPVLAIRAFDDNGYASNFGLMTAIDYAVQEGARVVSMSWGTETDSDFLERAVADAQKKGLVVVASAGNEPNGHPVYPASYPGVISVSAMNADGTIWENSNYGSAIDAAAPGRATFPVGHEGPPGPYAGTSIGAPYVAAELSKYMARHPTASPSQVQRDFKASLSEAGDNGKDPLYGYGAFDADAVARLRSK